MILCEKCKFSLLISEPENVFECRRRPPTGHIMPMPGRLQGQISMTVQTIFPIVQETWFCGEGELKNG